ncbi:hypothetical protein [Aequorivita xiaoshiensis]|uniref:Uncharacterized protein n=1 Tax=Aequorivita xiaoshiensis TaxID=2874476 RepID=A0A9X1R1Z0_9FLAO|nr:hypothetical protein [Aequorivita xiaoshiensis]MCG2430327.1 hypothetical protein [Aequorivita xiaoshiensis]
MLKRLSIIILVFCQGLLFSQNNKVSDINEKKLLYYFQEPGFLVPYIESELKLMTTSSIIKRNEIETYFKEVESFNRLKEDSKLQSEMANIVWNKYNAKSLINLELIDNKVNSEIISTILNYNYFLTIKTNTLGELIEFQFELFETMPLIDNDGKGNIRSGTLKKVKKIENFFINPKNKDYLKKVKNALYRLFDENNNPPIAIIEMYNKSYSKSFESFVSKGDTIEFSGSRSYDIDTEEISYNWKNIPVENQYYQHINKVNLTPNSPNQKIVISNDSIYYLNFNVSDGINDSNPINIKLIPIDKPKSIIPLYRDYKSIDYLTGKSIPKNENNEGQIYFDNEEVVLSNKIIISKEKIGQKFIRNLHLNDTIGYSYIDSVGVRSIKFKSNFTATNEEGFLKKRQCKSYYLYQINDKDLLSNPVKFNHKYVKRGAFSFRTGFSSTFFGDSNDFQLSSNDSLSLGTVSILLEIAVDISRKTRLSGFLDLGKNIDYKGYNFSPQPEIGGAFEYFLFKRYSKNYRIYPFIGLEFGATTFYTNEELSNPNNNSEEGSTNWIYTYGLRTGFEFEFETKWFLFSPGLLFKYGLYNKEFLKDNHFSNMSFIFNFKF